MLEEENREGGFESYISYYIVYSGKKMVFGIPMSIILSNYMDGSLSVTTIIIGLLIIILFLKLIKDLIDQRDSKIEADKKEWKDLIAK